MDTGQIWYGLSFHMHCKVLVMGQSMSAVRKKNSSQSFWKFGLNF